MGMAVQRVSKTKQRKWSNVIKERRLSWYGHVCRLDERTPAQQALNYVKTSKIKKLKGGQKTTWLKTIEKDFETIREHPNENIIELTQDRSAWRQRLKLKLR